MLKRFRDNELIKGSIILFLMINICNFLNYIFHFSMARMLGPSDYGVLAVLMSLIYIFSIPSEAIQTIVSRYSSQYSARKEKGKIKYLLFRGLKRGFSVALVLFLIYIPLSFFLSLFLKINLWLLLLTGLILFTFFTVPVARGVLQGMKKFKSLGVNMILEACVKLILGVFLVFIGFRAFGAILGFLAGLVLTFFSSFLFFGDFLEEKKEKEDAPVYSYGKPVFILITSIVLMYSLDVILARRFFSPEIAGKYSVISMLGKIILFGTWGVGKAMFPISSERHDNGKNNLKILDRSIKLVGLFSFVVLAAYLAFPKLIISVLFGKVYSDFSGILFITGLAFAMLSFSNILILCKLSDTKRRKIPVFALVVVLIQIMLLIFFHSSIFEFAIALLVSDFLMFLYSVIYFLKK